MYELPFRFAFVSELPFRSAFVSEWSPNAIRYSFFFIAWFVKHGWCSQDLPFGCLLHHFVSGVFLPSSISIPLQTRDHHGSIFLFLLAPFGFGFELFRFFSLANSSWNSCALCMRLSKTNHFVSPPTNCIRLSEGKESNFWLVRSSASWFKSLGTHCKFSSQSLVRKVSDSSIIKMVRGYFVLIHLLTA